MVGEHFQMKAYELTATVTADGQIELPNFRLSPTPSQLATVKVREHRHCLRGKVAATV